MVDTISEEQSRCRWVVGTLWEDQSRHRWVVDTLSDEHSRRRWVVGTLPEEHSRRRWVVCILSEDQSRCRSRLFRNGADQKIGALVGGVAFAAVEDGEDEVVDHTLAAPFVLIVCNFELVLSMDSEKLDEGWTIYS